VAQFPLSRPSESLQTPGASLNLVFFNHLGRRRGCNPVLGESGRSWPRPAADLLRHASGHRGPPPRATGQVRGRRPGPQLDELRGPARSSARRRE